MNTKGISTFQTSIRRLCLMLLWAFIFATLPVFGANCPSVDGVPHAKNDFGLVHGGSAVAIIYDATDAQVVEVSSELFAKDIQHITGVMPIVTNSIPIGNNQIVLIGTIGQNHNLDTLIESGKINVSSIQGGWERYQIQTVENPFPGVARALIIAGSDRRGTAYGVFSLSEAMGVSPWYWWADVPVQTKPNLYVSSDPFISNEPGVHYRGIFINDEDWGLNPWASKTFDPEFGNIGPKTYEKVFELMLRLRLNYIWPAMHACSREFGSVPENITLADKYGIVVGSSHCEPMLYNNVHWNEPIQGRWNYILNHDAIHSVWEDTAKARGQFEAVWTLGIRGIHDSPMETPPTAMPDKINLMSNVIKDQRALIDRYVTTNWGPIAQCFVPYKEVLPIYDAGLNVPDDVTLVWVDDNFGYIRRLSSPEERKRSGGAGIYWHLSYYGRPHSYTWINTTAPALMWEELHKAWENDTRTLWVINVGDIKPAEIGIDYFSRLAWNPDGFSLGAQRSFLREFAAKNFGEKFAQPITDLLMEFYRLGTIRKPELMNREWALSLAPEQAVQLESDYKNLLKLDDALSHEIPADADDAYTETIGFPAQVLGKAGLIFMDDRKIQEGVDISSNQEQISQLRDDLEAGVENYIKKISNGKWDHIMPGLVTGKDLTAWSSEVRWPWGEKKPVKFVVNTNAMDEHWRSAASADYQSSSGTAKWSVVEGLGPSGRAMALLPASSKCSWKISDTNAPVLGYDFKSQGADAEVFIDFLPTFRIYPGMKLRIAAGVDNRPPALIEVPGSSGAENENGTVRSAAVQNNFVRSRILLPNLSAGEHVFKIYAVDPGTVIDSVSLP
jgi:hypothetical protein